MLTRGPLAVSSEGGGLRKFENGTVVDLCSLKELTGTRRVRGGVRENWLSQNALSSWSLQDLSDGLKFLVKWNRCTVQERVCESHEAKSLANATAWTSPSSACGEELSTPILDLSVNSPLDLEYEGKARKDYHPSLCVYPILVNMFGSLTVTFGTDTAFQRRMNAESFHLMEKIIQGEHLRWSNLANDVLLRDLKRNQQLDVVPKECATPKNPLLGDWTFQAKYRREPEDSKPAEVPDYNGGPVTNGPAVVTGSPSPSDEGIDRDVSTALLRPAPKRYSRSGDSIPSDPHECGEELDTGMIRPYGFRTQLSGIAHELLQLRLHINKEQERFRQQEQISMKKKTQREKASMGKSRPKDRTKRGESMRSEVELRRQAPSKDHAIRLVDDLKEKVSCLLKQRRELREQDRILRLQLDEMRARWKESVLQVEQARTEKANILTKIDSIMS